MSNKKISTPTKQALVFAGGGARGAYEYGAWKALEEMNLSFDIVTGTSIGSVNGLLYVQHDFEAAGRLWEELAIDKVFAESIPVDDSLPELLFENVDGLRKLLKSYVSSKGADISPFIDTLSHYEDEDKFFSSEIDYALITIRVPNLIPLEIRKSDIKRGTLENWIQTSCACFPIFPLYEFDSASYLDGGYYDNLPVSTAFKMGADYVVAIDLNFQGGHKGYMKHPNVKYIKPFSDLGNIMRFEPANARRLIKLGYNDTMKAFNKLYGCKYTFERPKETGRLRLTAKKFVRELTLAEADLNVKNKGAIKRAGVLAQCTEMLSDFLKLDSPQETDMLQAAIEIAMTLFGYDEAAVYTYDSFFEALADDASMFKAQQAAERLSTIPRFFKEKLSAPAKGIIKLDDVCHDTIIDALLKSV